MDEIASVRPPVSDQAHEDSRNSHLRADRDSDEMAILRHELSRMRALLEEKDGLLSIEQVRELLAAKDSLLQAKDERIADLKQQLEARNQSEAELRQLLAREKERSAELTITRLPGETQYTEPRVSVQSQLFEQAEAELRQLRPPEPPTDTKRSTNSPAGPNQASSTRFEDLLDRLPRSSALKPLRNGTSIQRPESDTASSLQESRASSPPPDIDVGGFSVKASGNSRAAETLAYRVEPGITKPETLPHSSRWQRLLIKGATAAILVMAILMVCQPALMRAWDRARQWQMHRHFSDVQQDAKKTPSKITAAPAVGNSTMRLVVPKIDVDAIVVQGISDAALTQGPGHFPDTAMPGEQGNCVICGHRNIWGSVFADLNELDPGDIINVDTLQHRYVYKVTERKTVTPDAWENLDPHGDLRELTLFTCTEGATKRIIVHSVLDPKLTHSI